MTIFIVYVELLDSTQVSYDKVITELKNAGFSKEIKYKNNVIHEITGEALFYYCGDEADSTIIRNKAKDAIKQIHKPFNIIIAKIGDVSDITSAYNLP